jgi:DNA-binding SARP family transcriptional activator
MKPQTFASPPRPAKLIRPRPHGVLPRERLYGRLDAARQGRALWVSAPAGSGKTVLLSSYLEARGLPHLWYQLDGRDGDLASFFHYLSLAAPGAELPALTPEYLPGLAQFSQRFFETLFQHLPPQAALVLDNYQEVPESAPLHALLRDCLSLLPPGMTLWVISRAEPPAVYARPRLHGELAELGFDELRLTLDESRAIAASRRSDLEAGLVERCHAQARGWTAGLVLLLEQAHAQGAGSLRMKESARGLLFDYFSQEVFASLPAAAQAVLLETSALPRLTLPWAEALTGTAEARRVLADLHRRDFFVLKREEPEPVYEYHPLFRDFLLAEARRTLDAEAYAALLGRAAAVLAGAGQFEDAVPLYLETGDYAGLATLLPKLAPALLAQGRHQTLAEWLGAVPGILSADGWISYWLGHARLPFGIADARLWFEGAFARFEAEGDVIGLYLAWTAIVNSYLMEWEGFSDLDRWIDVYDRLRQCYPEPLPTEIEVLVHAATTVFFMRQPQHPKLAIWAEQARALLETIAADSQSVLLASSLLYHYVSIGNLNTANLVSNRLIAQLSTPGISPVTYIWSKLQLAFFHCVNGEAIIGLGHIQEALRQAETSGLYSWDFLLNWIGTLCCLGLGDLDIAEQFHSNCATKLRSGSNMEYGFYHFSAGFLAAQRGNVIQASDHFQATQSAVIRVGAVYASATTKPYIAWCLFRLGKDTEAADHLVAARNLVTRSTSQEYNCLMIEAHAYLDRDLHAKGLDALRRMLVISRENGGLVFGSWGPKFMTRLYAAALAADIEVPYTQSLIRRMDLTPPDPLDPPPNWPWPVEVRALGQFGITKDGVPLRCSGKAQQKPLELLTALIAHGGSEVPATTLADELWPEAEGDAAYRSLVTTVQRLRKLLELPEAIRFSEGAVSLDPRRVWVDARSFERWAEEASAALRAPDGAALRAARERLADLYRGPLLSRSESPWAVAARERLRARHAGLVRRLGRALEALGQEQEAAELYDQGIEADPSVEAFHQHLIHLRLQQGRVSEARIAYERCRRVFAAQFGKAPSRETEAMIRPYL